MVSWGGGAAAKTAQYSHLCNCRISLCKNFIIFFISRIVAGAPCLYYNALKVLLSLYPITIKRNFL